MVQSLLASLRSSQQTTSLVKTEVSSQPVMRRLSVGLTQSDCDAFDKYFRSQGQNIPLGWGWERLQKVRDAYGRSGQPIIEYQDDTETPT